MKKLFGMMILFCISIQTMMFGEFSLKYPDETKIEEAIESPNCGRTAQDPREIKSPSWMVYYGEAMDISDFYNYDPVIFLPKKHPLLAPLLVKNKSALAYLSLGDIKATNICYKEAKASKLLMGKNPQDGQRFVIDIRNPKWEELLLTKIIPEILEEGFGGLCLCNLDAAVNFEQRDPEKYAGMTEASVRLLAKINEFYGSYKIMLDVSGLLHIGKELLPYADMLLYEHLFTEKHGDKVILTSAQNYLMNASRLQALAATKAGLQVYTLDFWPEKDKTIVKNIYNKQRSYGFIPYVAERLTKVSSEP